MRFLLAVIAAVLAWSGAFADSAPTPMVAPNPTATTTSTASGGSAGGSTSLCQPSKPVIDPKTGLAVDITCPPQPDTNDGVCKPKCPAGWGLVPGDVDWSTGAYECTPSGVTKTSNLFYTCTYYDKDCIDPTKALNKIASSVSAASGGGGGSSGGGGSLVNSLSAESARLLASDNSFSMKAVAYATLDPQVLKMVHGKAMPFFEFFAEILKVITDYFRKIAVGYAMLGVLWLGGIHTAVRVFNDTRLESPARTVTRVIMATLLLFAPVPQKDSTGQIYTTQPYIFHIVRAALYKGTYYADELARQLNWIAAEKILEAAQINFAKTGVIAGREIEMARTNLEALAQDLRICWDYYGKCQNFLVPDQVLGDIQPQGSIKGSGSKYNWYYSPASCRKIEENYRRAVATYNYLVGVKNQSRAAAQALAASNYNLKGIFENPDAALSDPTAFVSISTTTVSSESQQVVKVLAAIAKQENQLGWVAYPLMTLPTLFYYVNMSQDLANLDIQPTQPNWLMKVVAFVTMPPGSSLFMTFNNLLNSTLGKAVGVLLPKFGSLLGGTASALGAMILTFMVMEFILAVAPAVIMTAAFVVRFIIWLVDIVKYLAVSPFVFLHTFTTSEYRNIYFYVVEGIVLALFPLGMLVVASFAYFGAFLFKNLFFYMTVKVLSMLADLGLVKVFGSELMGKILVWFGIGVVFFISVVGQILVGYKFMSDGIEWIYRKARFRDIGQVVQPQAIIERLAAKSGSPI